MKVKKKNVFFLVLFLEFGNFYLRFGKNNLIFTLGIGAEIGPQNQPRKIPVLRYELRQNLKLKLAHGKQCPNF